MISEKRINQFWSRVQKSPDCWEWTGGRQNKGYGTLSVNNRAMLAHRFSWVIHYGDIPPRLGVLHRCDNPGCVRPDHLFLGTQKENMQDARRKGRFVPRGSLPGEGCPTAKLTDEKVIAIRNLRRTSGIGYKKIGRMFGVAWCTIYDVVQRKTWKHLP